MTFNAFSEHIDMNTQRNFTAGDTVYSTEGQAAVFVGRVADGFAVETIYEDEDGEPYRSNVQVWPRVFAKAPTEVWDAEVKKLRAEVEAQQELARKAREEARNAALDAKQANERYKAHPDLRNLDLWIAGKVTHIAVIDDYNMHIGTVQEVLTTTEDRKTFIRLCGLFVDPKANKYWTQYARYSDGSGSSGTPCLLATSFEDARDQLLAWVLKRLHDTPHHMKPSLLIRAEAAGVVLPESLAKDLAEAKAVAHAHKLKQAQESLDNYRRHVAAAEQTIAALTAPMGVAA